MSLQVSSTTPVQPISAPSTSKPSSLSYQDVVNTMTQYEFPPSDNDESTSPVCLFYYIHTDHILLFCCCFQLSSSFPTDGFDPKKHPDGVFTFRKKAGCSYFAVSNITFCYSVLVVVLCALKIEQKDNFKHRL